MAIRPAHVDGLRDRLRSRWQLRERPIETWQRVLLETFDWRLERLGGRLWLQHARTVALTWERPGSHRFSSTRVRDVPRFAEELPGGEPWSELAEVIAPRRLLERVTVVERRSRLDLLDAEEKIVGRIALVEASARDPLTARTHDVEPWIELEELRGYPDTAQAVDLLIERCACTRLENGPFDGAFAALGLTPGLNPSKLRLVQRPDANARVATCEALEGLLDIALVNESGVRRDLDIEFLHDYRVACRRLRSLLSELGHLFERRGLERWKEELRWLGSLTGPTRDLDVLVWKWNGLVAELDGVTQERLLDLRRAAEERRERVQRTLVEGLDSPRYRRLVDGLREFLASQRTLPGPDVGTLREEVEQRLTRRFERIRERGATLVANSPADDYHRLRIQCKRLRYLLDVHRALWDKDDVKRAGRALERLQDCLGDFNDAEVQASLVRRIAEEAELEPVTILSAGELLERLRRRSEHDRKRFAKDFQKFSSKANVACFRRLGGKRAKRRKR